jgi:hypothetical protein
MKDEGREGWIAREKEKKKDKERKTKRQGCTRNDHYTRIRKS